ncbi:MAG: hypothetical protein HUU50_08775 [Candidatus Brocadiae bacterium]|nr:hypothetical protein [Candidatus Brocadiia bacterium]
MFIKCSCQKIWKTREEFLSDPMVHLKGYQVHFQKLTAGFFLFNHEMEKCGTTLSLEVEKFLDLYKGPIFQDSQKQVTECAGHCLYQKNLEACPNKCECIFVQSIMKTIELYPKKS